MKIIITESQYKNLFEGTSNFEKEEKLINTLLSKFNYDGICGYDILVDDEMDRVSSVMIGFSREWFNTNYYNNNSHRYIVKSKDDIEQNIKKYLGLNNIYVGLFEVEECK